MARHKGGNSAAPNGSLGWFGGAPAWPALLIVLLSFLALVVAWLGRPLLAAITYGVLVTAGAVLAGVQRRFTMVLGLAAREAKAITMTNGEKAAILILLVGAMANAWVLALDVARRTWAG